MTAENLIRLRPSISKRWRRGYRAVLVLWRPSLSGSAVLSCVSSSQRLARSGGTPGGGHHQPEDRGHHGPGRQHGRGAAGRTRVGRRALTQGVHRSTPVCVCAGGELRHRRPVRAALRLWAGESRQFVCVCVCGRITSLLTSCLFPSRRPTSCLRGVSQKDEPDAFEELGTGNRIATWLLYVSTAALCV